MKLDSKEIIKGIKLHPIKTNKFKTDITAVFLTIPLSKDMVTYNCMVPAVLERGTAKYKTQEEISKKLENMYGTTFDCGIEKTGDNHVIKFYLESINNNFIPNKEDILEQQFDLLLDIIFNPILENGVFKEEYVESEKENIRQLIKSKIDSKDQYALDKCTEAMYGDEPYALYKYGNEEDLDKINAENLYNRYLEIVNNAKIDIFVSGDIDQNEIENFVTKKLKTLGLKPREPKYIVNNEQTEKKKIVQTKTVQEKLDIAQGKLVLGLDIMENRINSRFAVSIYNAILGESANSKLFQNVREKASLAYSAGSTYIRQKNNIFIKCGIEIPNYQKALDIINKQLEDMKKGNFTDEDIKNAKKFYTNGINSVEEEQDTEIVYYMGQELAGYNTSLEKYLKEIESVTRDQIVDIANKIQVNTIFFLRN